MSMFRKLIRWGRITEAGADDGTFATQKISYLGKNAETLIVNPYGLHGNVPADGFALMFAVEGDPENRAAIAWTPNDRPKLAGGEVAFYHPPTGCEIHLRASGDIDITTGSTGTANINVICKDLNVTCDTANVTAATSADVTAPITKLTSSTSITLDTPATTITGALNVQGAATFTTSITSAGKNIGDSHSHTGSSTAPLGPVSNTGVPI